MAEKKPSHPKLRFPWRRWLWPLYRRLLLSTSWPILVGPWRGEIGFEVLYWIPFLDRLKAAGLAPERLIPISRGGAAAWYGCPKGLELYDMRTPQDVRVENRRQYAQEDLLKQMHVSTFDRQILRDAAESLGLGRKYHVLHPSWLNHLLMPFWEQNIGVAAIDRHVQYQTLTYPAVTSELPERFVAVRFYHRPTWPQHPQTASLARAVIRTIAAEIPVVLMDPQMFFDDHDDLIVPDIPNVYRLTDLVELTAQNNLAVQSAVLARASAFVGTYGGFAQLALRLGKPSVSFYYDWQGTCFAHLALAELLSLQSGAAFHAIALKDTAMLTTILPEAVLQPPSKPSESYTTAVPA